MDWSVALPNIWFLLITILRSKQTPERNIY